MKKYDKLILIVAGFSFCLLFDLYDGRNNTTETLLDFYRTMWLYNLQHNHFLAVALRVSNLIIRNYYRNRSNMSDAGICDMIDMIDGIETDSPFFWSHFMTFHPITIKFDLFITSEPLRFNMFRGSAQYSSRNEKNLPFILLSYSLIMRFRCCVNKGWFLGIFSSHLRMLMFVQSPGALLQFCAWNFS